MIRNPAKLLPPVLADFVRAKTPQTCNGNCALLALVFLVYVGAQLLYLGFAYLLLSLAYLLLAFASLEDFCFFLVGSGCKGLMYCWLITIRVGLFVFRIRPFDVLASGAVLGLG